MNRIDTIDCAATLERLYAERLECVRQIADLGGDPMYADEIDACLRRIDTLNATLLSLARQTADREALAGSQSHTASAPSDGGL